VNDVNITIAKALDESPWASGYQVDLQYGSHTIGAGALRQGYVALRTPVGNGIDWKVGMFDGVTGYEGNTGYSNPNYTRSYGWNLNPATFAGAIGSYKVCDMLTAQAGIANRASGTDTFGAVPSQHLSSKNFIGLITLTAPESLGFLKGSTLNASTVQGFDNGAVNIYSVNATLATPVTGLKVGLAYDKQEGLATEGTDGNIYGVYATFQATDKLAFNLRGEYIDGQNLGIFAPNPKTGKSGGKGEELTATVQYDLWANVVSRLEFRWDHTEVGTEFNANKTESAYLVALNLVYKF
ncbi:MAG: outer membrane beta-barrel protein, partial [Verrucomicrobiota bacterium]